SDPGGLATTAVRDGDDWVIDGSKRYITNAPLADVFMIFARTTPDVPPGKGISVFYVPRETAGLTVGPRDKKMGQAGAWTADVYLDGARVPDEALIGGTPGTGYATAMRCLAHGRLHIAALCVGLAQRLVDESVAWAVTRRLGGGRVADRAVQIHGGAGYMRGVPVERLYRDARLFRIYEGTSQIQQLVIARQLTRGRP